MGFNNITGFVFLGLIPVVLLFYLYKNKSREADVASLFIWNRVLEKNDSKKRALSKLKKCLSLILQILIIALFSLFISQPYLKTTDKGKDIILIVDCSMNMLARNENGQTVFEATRAEIKDFINSLDNKNHISVIKMNKKVEIIAEKEGKSFCLDKINSLKPEYNKANLDLAINLAERLSEKDTQIYIFSLSYKSTENENIHFYNIGEIKENTGILNAFADTDNYVIKAQIKNYSEKMLERTIMLYGEERLIAFKKIKLEPNSAENVSFYNLRQNYAYYKLQTKENESLSADDCFYIANNDSSNLKLKLFGSDNYYLEKAVSVGFKGKIEKKKDFEDNFDIAIYNEKIPLDLPKKGNILIINPKNDTELFKTSGESSCENLSLNIMDNFEYMDKLDFKLTRATSLENMPDFLKPLVLSADNPIIYGGKRNNQKIIIISFDLYNSDLVLKSDFPIMIKNILKDFSENTVLEKSNAVYNESISLSLEDRAELIMPKEKIELTEESKEIKAQEIGIYKLSMSKGDYYLAVNPDLEEEKAYEIKNKSKEVFLNKDIRNIFTFLIIALLVVEWLVINNEN